MKNRKDGKDRKDALTTTNLTFSFANFE